jgi:hypothetical protein
MRMNLNDGDGDGDVLASTSLSESKEMTPCIVRRKKKGACKKKGRKTPHIVR